MRIPCLATTKSARKQTKRESLERYVPKWQEISQGQGINFPPYTSVLDMIALLSMYSSYK